MSEKEKNMLSPKMQPVEKAGYTDRNWEEYAQFLDLTKEDLQKWQVIVDLGSGISQGLSYDLDKMGYKDKTVISIDPILGLLENPSNNLSQEDLINLRSNAQPNTVAGLAQELPLKDESADAILALFSVPRYLDKSDDINNFLDQVVRVLKPGGEARIYPISKYKNNFKIVPDYLAQLSKNEFEYELILKRDDDGDPCYYLLIIRKKVKK
jgi:ubiquinone/menaquinone biosynthesis C-methylase UbiE